MEKQAYKILVVDDEEEILSFYRRILNRQGLDVATAGNGEAALDLIRRETYDLIVADIKMPGVNGIELLKMVKEITPQSKVIVMTGQATVETAIESIRLGAFDYILKPFNVNELLASIDRCLEYAQLQRQEKVFRETTYLYRLAQEITKSRDEKELLQFILEWVVKALKADAGSIFIIDPSSANLVPMARTEEGKKELSGVRIGEKVVGWVAEKRQPLLIQGGFENQPQLRGNDIRSDILSSMVAPLIHQESLIGVVCLSRLVRGTPYPFSSRDLESLEIFVLHATLIIVGIRHQQALSELDELKSEFLANASHELRTPLMAISGALELLSGFGAREKLDEKEKSFFDLINRNAERMRRLVNDLLDFSRMETGKIRLEKARFDMALLIEESATDLELKAKEKNIAISIETPGKESWVCADRERIRQVLVNLISNAIKFSEGGGSIAIRCAREGKDLTHLSVADSGIGIPDDKREKIFEKFYQVDGSVSRQKSGFGIGLAIARSILEAHDGRIWVESTLGRGSTFHVTFPTGIE